MTDNDDIARRLRAAVEPTSPRDEDIAAIAARGQRRRAVLRTTSAGVTAAAVVLAVVAATALAQRMRVPDRIELADAPASASAGSPDTTAPDAAPAWRDLPPAPLDARWAAFSASTGDQVLIWGGYAWASDEGSEGPRSDGAVYDGTGWAPLPDGPLPALMGHGGAAAWTGDELWIVGGTGGDDGRTPSRAAAAFDPQRQAWRELPSVPTPIAGGAWVGDRFVAVAATADGDRPVYALATGEQRWQELDPLPPVDPAAADNSDLHVVATDDHVAVIGMGAAFALAPGAADAGWQPLPSPDDGDRLPNVRGAVAEEGAVVVLLSDSTYRYDVGGGAWSRIADGLQPDPPQPIPLVRTSDALVAVDVVNGRMHALSSDDAWVALAALDESRVDATVEVVGDQVVVWGGMGSEEPGTAEGRMLDP